VQYTTGTVSVTNGSNIVGGAGTVWASEASVGDIFFIREANVSYEISSVDNDGQVHLSTPYAGPTATGLRYAISRDFTPLLSLPYPQDNDIGTGLLFKRAVMGLDIAVSNIVKGAPPVQSATTTAPPGSPAAAQLWLVPTGATGAWSGQAAKLAQWASGAWIFYTPNPGSRAWALDTKVEYLFDGTNWLAGGDLDWQGVWNASTNTPTITSGPGIKGRFYKVGTAGSTTIDGNTGWHVGDWVINDGVQWQKIDNYEAVTSVAGRIGAVVLAQADIAGLTTADSPTFAGLTVPGITTGSASALSLSTSGGVQVKVANATSAVNCAVATGAATGANPNMSVAGTDPNIGTGYSAKGTSGHSFFTGGGTQFVISNAAASANYMAVSGASTGVQPFMQFTGSDAIVPAKLLTKGTAGFTFDTGGWGNTQLAVSHVASAVNNLQVTGNSTGKSPAVQATGSDGVSNIIYAAKGAGHYFQSAGATTQFAVGADASAVNNIQATGRATGSDPYFYSQGTDTDVGTVLGAKGAGGFSFITAALGAQQFRVVHAASAVNFVVVQGNPTGNGGVIRVDGSDTNTWGYLYSKGTSGVYLGTGAVGGGGGPVVQFLAAHTASAVNNFQVTGAASGAGQPSLSTIGADPAINTVFNTKATGAHYFNTGGGTQLRIADTASAVDFWSISGSAANLGQMILSAQGSDTGIPTYFLTKGSSAHSLQTGNAGNTQFVVSHIASTVNYAQATGATTGTSPVFAAQGSDAAVNLVALSKGGAVISLNTGGGVQFVVANATSAVNHLQTTGAASGSAPTIATRGADANNGFIAASNGSGSVYLTTGGGTQLVINHIASAVNRCAVTGSVTGSGVVYGADGSDANVSINISPKGTGTVNLNSPVVTSLNGGSADVATWNCSRNANYTGGTPGFVNSNLYLGNAVGSGVTANEWALSTVLTSNATSGQHVGISSKVAANAGATAQLWSFYGQFYGSAAGGTVVGMELQGGRNAAGTAVALDITQPSGWTIDTCIRVPEGMPTLANAVTTNNFIEFQTGGGILINSTGAIYLNGTVKFGTYVAGAVTCVGSANIQTSDGVTRKVMLAA